MCGVADAQNERKQAVKIRKGKVLQTGREVNAPRRRLLWAVGGGRERESERAWEGCH